jgi:hypothetical protein
LLLANTLASGAGESEMRAAINRSYYAVFHSLERLFQRCVIGAAPEPGKACLEHTRVGLCLNAWQSCAHPQKIKMALGADAAKVRDHFWRCKQEREFADYVLAKTYTPEIVKAHFKRIKKLEAFAAALERALCA